MITELMIVILNMDLRDDTLELIDSLLKAGASPEKIILVDNGSKDGSVEAVREIYGNTIHILDNPENIGSAAGNNQGFDLAYRLGAEWVLLLNNDTIVSEDFFDQIDLALAENHDYVILSPAIFYYSDPEILWHLGAYAIPGTLLARNLYQKKKIPDNLPRIFPVDFVTTCAILIHKKVYQTIGLFDPQYIIYWEEVDFCHRAREAGYKIAILTQAKLWHKVSKTMGKQKPRTRYLITRNMIFYTRKNAHGFEWPIMISYLFVRLVITFLKDIVFGRYPLISPLLRGWRDGWNTPGY